MKNIKYIGILLAGLLFFSTSCTDFLDEQVLDAISVDYIYNTPEGLEVGVNGLYNLQRKNNMPGNEGNPLRMYALLMVGTDLGITRTYSRPYQVAGHTPQGLSNHKWIVPYQIIDRANALIKAAPNIEMNETAKNKLVAQARVIRGEVYLELLSMYDRILLITEPTTPENIFEEKVYTPANPADVYALIDADLDFAIEHLDWSVPAGRYGKGVAKHIKGKSALWQEKWQEAANQFDGIITNGTHGLVAINDVFGQNQRHREAMFLYTRDFDLGGNTDDLAGGRGTWLGSAFQSRYYEMPNNNIIHAAEYGGQALGWYFPNSYLKSLYDQENDLRFETYYYPDTLLVNNPAKANFGQPVPQSQIPDNYRQYHWSLKKYRDLEKPVTTNDSWKDIVYYRFAETLLLGAEAHWQLSGRNPTNSTALDYVNRVRTRAGLADDPFTEFTLDNYLEESARELAFEFNRWFLLKRLGVLVERQSLHYRYGGNKGGERAEPMQDYMVRFPIPQSQMDLMGGTFAQNPGYPN